MATPQSRLSPLLFLSQTLCVHFWLLALRCFLAWTCVAALWLRSHVGRQGWHGSAWKGANARGARHLQSRKTSLGHSSRRSSVRHAASSGIRSRVRKIGNVLQCSFCNFAWRKVCFKCPLADKTRERKPSTETVRRPAPEVAVAEAEAKAAASAARLRAAGLEAQAASLEKQAGEQRKFSESSPPPQKGGRSFGESFHARGRCGVGTCGRSRRPR